MQTPNWRATVPAQANAITWASRIHRYVTPREWPAALESVPEEFRSDAEQYLRGLAQRMRALRAIRQRKAA